MELSGLLLALRRHWIIALLAVTGFVSIGWASAFLPPDRYSGTAVLFAQPSAGQSDYNSIQAVQFLLPGLAEQAEVRTLTESARKRLPTSLARVDGEFSAVVEPNSSILRISAESQSKAFVAPAANALADELVKQNPATDLLRLSFLDRARSPISPSGPARLPVFAGSLMLGLIAGVLGAVGADAIQRRMDSADEIRIRFGTDILGEIPPFPRLHRHPATTAELFASNKYPSVVESFQQLRTNIEIALTTRDLSAITVTSSQVGEGKTTICSALGWVLASVGHETILIDADMRRPRLHELLGGSRGPGVASAVTADPHSLTRTTQQSSLYLIPAGVPDRHPAEVISAALPRLLEWHDSNPSQLVIVDSPPLGATAEAGLIAAMTKHVILVVNARRNHPEDIEHSLAQLHQAGAEVLGVVVNRARARRHRQTSQRYYYVRTNDQHSRRRSPSAVKPTPSGIMKRSVANPGEARPGSASG